MKLYASLKIAIVKQFCADEDMEYLAALYGVRPDKIETVIREALRQALGMTDKPVVDDAGGALGEEK